MNFKKITLLCLVVAAMTFVSACNTVEGFGKDVRNMGQSMENAAAKKTGN